jgi:hypothetical protein
MSETAAALERLIEIRGRNLPLVQREVARWQAIDDHLDELQNAVTELKAYAYLESEAAHELAVPRLAELRLRIAQIIETYRVLGARFARGTINIGVSGAARMGKSTLLQAISGLGDDQIPAGDGIPVTAVRSRIFHSTVRRAELRMHTPDSFLSEVIAPHHAEAAIPQVPRTIEEFRSWRYPPADEESDSEIRSVLVRLRECQTSLPSYEDLLTGGTRDVEFSELRQYVAYPTSEEQERHGGRVARPYLAVREARIDCPFPHEDVANLAVIDLPGLGDLSPDAEGRHVDGLRNEVDAVLLVKRAAETSSFWGKADVKAMKLLDTVRGFIRSEGEFAFIVVNRNDLRPKLDEDLRGDILRNVNGGRDGRHVTVFETDVRDRVRVRAEVLGPLLRRLATGLPKMDAEGLAWAGEQARAVSSGISAALRDLSGLLKTVRDPNGVPEEVLEAKADHLRSALARRLSRLVGELTAGLYDDAPDESFITAVETAYEDVLKWAADGFGLGTDEWRHRALDVLITERNAAAFAGPELNRIRLEISKRFGALDDFFSAKLSDMWDRVAAIFREHCGALLGDGDGKESLAHLTKAFSESAQPCPTLARSVDALLDVRLEYRTLLYPRVRADLGGLNLQVRHPQAGEQIQQIAVELTEEGAEDLYRIISGLAEQAAYRTRKSLLGERVTPSVVIQAVVEQFEDALIRSGASVQEFRRFVRSYRNELWPDEFRGIDEANARYARVTRAIAAIDKELQGAA